MTRDIEILTQIAHEWRVRAAELRRSAVKMAEKGQADDAFLAMVGHQTKVYEWCAADIEKALVTLSAT